MARLAPTLFILLCFPLVASARPAYKKALGELLQLPASSRLADCRTCHLPPRSEDDRPHNAFGGRLVAVRATLRKAGKPSSITDRILALADEDADRDGVPNLLELLAGNFPGDATDRPSPDALTLAHAAQKKLLASLHEYRWRPFERVERPDLPRIPDTSWVRNPIDRFVSEQHNARQLRPRPEAPRWVLLRRVYLDLIGLPPSPQDLEEFLVDPRPDAYEQVVARLLASPRYGERWGRHWMDVWRYSDWAGFGAQVRDSQPHIWHWRDWTVESLNAGKSYDRIVQEMLAADELAPRDPNALRATGFLVRNYKLLSREKWLQDCVDHTGMAFLGLTLGCAKCHDHMYDAITQKEYYQFRALFTPHNVRTDPLPGWPDAKINGLPRAFDANPEAPTYLLLRGDDRNPEKIPLTPGVPESLGSRLSIEPVSLPQSAFDPERQPFVREQELTAAARAMEAATKAHALARHKFLGSLIPALPPLQATAQFAGMAQEQESLTLAELDLDLAQARHTALSAVFAVETLEPGTNPSTAIWKERAVAANRAQRNLAVLEARRAHLVAQKAVRTAPAARRKALEKQLATARTHLEQAEKALATPLTPTFTPRPVKTYPRTSTGRRLALARWLTSRDNPLAARVAVNQVWMRHFGKGIVPSVFDFGRNGQPPSHPALLDWLAVELMESNWSLKHLHRLIVTSATYRQDSTPSPDNLARDPDNVYLWRFTPRRVEAEVVRDSVLRVSGQLDLTLGGPDIPHGQGLTVPRRSLYFQHAQEKQMEFLQIFDVAGVTECYARKQAILPQQALALLNSDLVLQQARSLASELAGDDRTFIRKAFEHVLSRSPTSDETATCLDFLREKPGARTRGNLVHVLFNHHEFVTLR